MAANIKYNPAGEDGIVDQVRGRAFQSDQPYIPEMRQFADRPPSNGRLAMSL